MVNNDNKSSGFINNIKKGLKKLRKNEAIEIEEEKALVNLTAKDVMTKPILINQNDDINILLDKLKKEKTNVCIIVDDNFKFLGEVRDEDIIKLFMHQVKYEPLTKILNIGYRRELLYKKPSEIMSKHNAVVHINTPINTIIELINVPDSRYIPVLDEDGKVIGVITPSNVIDLLNNY